MRLEDALPWLKGQRFLGILENVYTTRQTYYESAAKVEMEYKGIFTVRYFNVTFKPLVASNGELSEL